MSFERFVRFFSASRPRPTKPQRPRPSRCATTEEFRIGERVVTVERRAYLRKITLTVRINGGLRVVAPASLPLKSIAEFVRKNETWIRQRDAAYERVRAAHPVKRYTEGELFPLVGRQLRLTFAEGRGRPHFDASETELIARIPAAQWGSFNTQTEHAELAGPLAAVYAEMAKQLLRARADFWSAKMQLRPRSVKFRSQKTRWGSCSSRGDIALNLRLIVAPLETIDYVVIHELAHLAHHNHSPAFWKLVVQFSPQHRRHQEWLRLNQYQADFLAKRSELYEN